MKIMKIIMKFVLGFVAVTFIIIAVFWGSLVYVSGYKITKVDTSAYLLHRAELMNWFTGCRRG